MAKKKLDVTCSRLVAIAADLQRAEEGLKLLKDTKVGTRLGDAKELSISALDLMVAEILKRYLNKVKLEMNGNFLVVTVDHHHFSLPIGKLSEIDGDLYMKVRFKMSVNTKIVQKSGSRLFDGLTFEEAIALYWQILEEAGKVNGLVPNHHAQWVTTPGNAFPDSPAHRMAIRRREEIRQRDGYLVEEFSALGFVISKGNNYGHFTLKREVHANQRWPRREYLGHIVTHSVKPNSSTEIAVAMFRNLMQRELYEICFTIFTDGEYKISVNGEVDQTTTLKEAVEAKNRLEDAVYSPLAGEIYMSSRISIGHLGAIVFSRIGGEAVFVPNEDFRPGLISQERFLEIVTAAAVNES